MSVNSVNGKQGFVRLETSDIPESIDKYFLSLNERQEIVKLGFQIEDVRKHTFNKTIHVNEDILNQLSVSNAHILDETIHIDNDFRRKIEKHLNKIHGDGRRGKMGPPGPSGIDGGILQSSIDHGSISGLDDYDHTWAFADTTIGVMTKDYSTTGIIQGDTLTDGTLSINSGSITGAINGTFSGTLQAGQITSTGNILIADNGFIGSVSIPEVIQIDHASGIVKFSNISVDIAGRLLVDSGLVTIGNSNDSDAEINFKTESNVLQIEWVADSRGGQDNTLTFRCDDELIWNLRLVTNEANMNIIVDGTVGGGTLTMQDYDIVIEENTELQGTVTLSGLIGPGSLYIDINELVTVGAPASGDFGFWDRTGTKITTKTAGDDLELGGDLIVDTDTLLVDSTFHSVGIGQAASVFAKLSVGSIVTGFSGPFQGAAAQITVAPSQAGSATYTGLLGTVLSANLAFDMSGSLTALSGTVNYSQFVNDITVDEVAGINAVYAVSHSTGEVTDLFGINLMPTINALGGVLVNHIGLNIPDITGATNNFAIVTKAGKVLFGDETTIGNGTDELQVSATGDMSFLGTATVWNDIQFSISTAKVPASNFPAWVNFGTNTKKFTFAVGDFVDLEPNETHHSYKEGSNLTCHVHFYSNGVDGTDRTVKYQVDIGITNPGGVYSESQESAQFTIPASTTDRTHFIHEIAELDGTGVEQGAEITIRFSRIATDSGSDPSGDPFVSMVGIHIEENRVGSRTELAA